MSNEIYATFGTEREWQETLAKTTDALVAIGARYGDEEALMRAKAQCVIRILRTIVEQVPSVEITTKIPDGLSAEQQEVLTNAIRDATLRGIEVAMTHSVQALMADIYDLCTSKFRGGGER